MPIINGFLYGLIIALFLTAVGSMKRFADGWAQAQYMKLPRIERLMVIEERKPENNDGRVSYGDSDVTIFNFWSLKTEVEKTISAIHSPDVSELRKCVYDNDHKCNLLLVSSTDTVMVDTTDLSEIQARYIREFLMDAYSSRIGTMVMNRDKIQLKLVEDL